MQEIQQKIETAWEYFLAMNDINDRITAVRNLLNKPDDEHPRELRWLILAVASLLQPQLEGPRDKKTVGGLAYFLYQIMADKKIDQVKFTCLINQNHSLQEAFRKNQINDWLSAIELLEEQAKNRCLDKELDDEAERISRQSLNKGYLNIETLVFEKLAEFSKNPEQYRSKEADSDALTKLPNDDTQLVLLNWLRKIVKVFLDALNAKWSQTLRLTIYSGLTFGLCFVAYLLFREMPFLSVMAWLSSIAFLLSTYFFALWLITQLIWLPVRWIDSRLFHA
jgi:hypothetical protein